MSAPIDARALLLGNRAEDELFRAWDRSVLHLAHGDHARFRDLFSVDELSRTVLGGFASGRAGSASLRAAFRDHQGSGRTFPAPLEMGKALFQAGMTLAINDLETTNPRLAELAGALQQFLRLRGRTSIACFLSPDAHGFPWHFDFTHVLALQIEGTKTWQLGKTRVNAPPFHLQADGLQPATRDVIERMGMKVTLPDDGDVDEITLAPGDVLYLPPGTWHRATAHGVSCHLSVIMHPVSFARLLRATLAAAGLRHESWRRDVQPLAITSRAELLGHLASCLAEIKRDLASITPEQLAQVMETLATSPVVRETLLDRAVDVL